MSTAPRPGPHARSVSAVGLLLCVLGVAAFLLLPLYGHESVRSSASGSVRTITHESALAVNGARGLLIGLIPVVLAALPLCAPRRARAAVAGVSAAGLTVFVLLGAMTMGLFVLPAAALLWLAFALALRERRAG